MDTKFEIATLSLNGGGRIGVCGLPGYIGDLSSDLQSLTDWKPDIVISMTELSEMSDCGIANLDDVLRAENIDWLHIPIVDFGGLSGANLLAWPSISKRLHGLLDDQKSILLHCKGGQGRSGMIGLRLMVERGEDSVIALARLREVRPGAVETSLQMEWASDP